MPRCSVHKNTHRRQNGTCLSPTASSGSWNPVIWDLSTDNNGGFLLSRLSSSDWSDSGQPAYRGAKLRAGATLRTPPGFLAIKSCPASAVQPYLCLHFFSTTMLPTGSVLRAISRLNPSPPLPEVAPREGLDRALPEPRSLALVSRPPARSLSKDMASDLIPFFS